MSEDETVDSSRHDEERMINENDDPGEIKDPDSLNNETVKVSDLFLEST